MQRERTFSRLAIVFSKLIIMAENRAFIPIWHFENYNSLIFVAGIIGIKGLSKTVGYDFRVMHPFYQAIGRHGFGNPVSLKGVALDGL